jgi:translation initiation factor IF-2
MAKSVINLMRELGAKTTAEVVELLTQVGFDTASEDFSIAKNIVDDATVEKLRELRSGNGAKPAKAAKPAAKTATKTAAAKSAPAAAETLDVRQPVERKTRKDFFGTTKKEEVAAPKPAAASTRRDTSAPVRERRTVGAEASAAAPARQSEAAPAADDAAKPPVRRSTKIDLSQGPRIISMPDPAEVRQIRVQREAGSAPDRPAADGRPQPAAGASAPGGAARPGRKRDKPGAAKEDFSGRRRKIKEIGGKDDDERMRSKKRVFKVARQALDVGAVVPHIKITGPMQLREVARQSGVKVPDIVRFLMRELDIMATINYYASVSEIELIAEHFGIKHTVQLSQEPEGELLQFEHTDQAKLVPRPPVVTVMGHVDHGKTKLLDVIRLTNVVAGEAGGITQHIGAYMVEKQGKLITFIDTPGHEAFTAMRARGSQVTDIVILVVAADDGVMPQTIEAINHAKAAGVPIIVAVNKMDKPDANPEKVKNQLSEYGLVSEEWGGDTPFVYVSALKGEGIDQLLEMVLLNAELLDPHADPHAPAFGVVIESKVDIGIGVVATILVQQGTLTKGQFILSGKTVGRIKRMENEHGVEVNEAGPSMPVRIIGFNEPPENGEKIYAFKNKKQGQAIADQRVAEVRVKAAAGASGRMSLEAFFLKAASGETTELDLIVKADVGGSLEAVVESLKKLDVQGYTVKVISSGVGQINETDVNLAVASGAVVIGFSVGVAQNAKRLAEREKIDVRLYDIIYKLTEDIELALKGMLKPEFEEKALGRLEVRAIFKETKNSVVSGGYVLDGVVKRGAKYRLRRKGEVLWENGKLDSLKRFKDDVREVASGFECGFVIEGFGQKVEEGDILEFFEVVEVKRD